MLLAELVTSDVTEQLALARPHHRKTVRPYASAPLSSAPSLPLIVAVAPKPAVGFAF